MPHRDWIVTFATPGDLALLAGLASMLGAIVGSFLGAALVRLPEGRSVLTGRSACDSCGRRLGVTELVPVLSWLLQRGRCRACGAPIGGWQLACELGAAVIGAGSVLAGQPGLALAGMALGWQLLLLALLDLRHLWLPRSLTAVLALTGLTLALLRAWTEADAAPLAIAGGGALLGWGLLATVALAYRRTRGREGLGAGDPPLLGAIGLFVGPLGVVHVLLGGAVIGLLAAVVLHVSGRKIAADTALPLGTLLAATAWPVFLLQGFG